MNTLDLAPSFYIESEHFIAQIQTAHRIKNIDGKKKFLDKMIAKIEEQLSILNQEQEGNPVFPVMQRKLDWLRAHADTIATGQPLNEIIDHELLNEHDIPVFPAEITARLLEKTAGTILKTASMNALKQCYMLASLYNQFNQTPDPDGRLAVDFACTLYMLFIYPGTQCNIKELLPKINALLREHYSDAHHPLYDYLANVRLPKKEPEYFKDWQKALTSTEKKTFSIGKAFNNFAGIERYLKAEGNLLFTEENIKKAQAGIFYSRAAENPELAALCFKYKVPQTIFSRCLDVLATTRRTTNVLPDIVIDGSDVATEDTNTAKGYYYLKLPSSSLEGLILGYISKCCQSIGRNSEHYVIDGVTREHNGFYVLVKAKNASAKVSDLLVDGVLNHAKFDIVGQSYAWISEHGQLVLDSSENLSSVPKSIVKNMLYKFAEQVTQNASEHGIFRVTVGAGGKTPAFDNLTFTDPVPLEGSTSRDSKKQYELSCSFDERNQNQVAQLRQIVLNHVRNNRHNRSVLATVGVFNNDKEIVLTAISQFSSALRDASLALQNDEEVVLPAVTHDGLALRYASAELQNNKRIVLAAVSQNGNALRYASPHLRKDRDVILAAVANNGMALEYASAELRNDREVVWTAVAQNGLALPFNSDDKELVKLAVSQYGRLLEIAAEALQRDKEVVLAALTNDRSALEYVSPMLLKEIKRNSSTRGTLSAEVAIEYLQNQIKMTPRKAQTDMKRQIRTLKYGDDLTAMADPAPKRNKTRI